MYTTIEMFERNWMYESEATGKLLNALTDQSLAQPVADTHRTLVRVAWHIVTTIPEMMSHVGLKFTLDQKAPVPKTAAEILKAYQQASEELLKQVKENWNDQTLDVEDDLYGETWKRGRTLYTLLIHEIHHRGQMSVLMRQAGLKVPGIYGPAMEEWSQYNTEAPEI